MKLKHFIIGVAFAIAACLALVPIVSWEAFYLLPILSFFGVFAFPAAREL